MNITLAPINEKRKFNPYRKKESGTLVYVYLVDGTPEEIAGYKADKGALYREDEVTKKPIFFTNRPVGSNGKLVRIEKNGKVDFIADTTKEEIFASLEKQFGTTQATEKLKEMGY